MRRALLTGFLLAAVMLSGCTTTTPAGSPAATTAAASPTAEVGKPADFTWRAGGAGQVTIHTMKWQKTGKGDYAAKPEHGAYLVMDVTVEAVKGTVSANPLYFVAVDKDGRTYDGLSISGYTPQLDSGDITQGKKRRGFVSIDMPQGASSLELQTPLGDSLVEWKVPAK